MDIKSSWETIRLSGIFLKMVQLAGAERELLPGKRFPRRYSPVNPFEKHQKEIELILKI